MGDGAYRIELAADPVGVTHHADAPSLRAGIRTVGTKVQEQPHRVAQVLAARPGGGLVEVDEGLWHPLNEYGVARRKIVVADDLLGAGERDPALASWKRRISAVAPTSCSSDRVARSGGTWPSTNVTISLPRSSMPSTRGDPSNPTFSRWRRSEWTNGVCGPVGRRTESPMRVTPWVMRPPVRATSSRASMHPSLLELAAVPEQREACELLRNPFPRTLVNKGYCGRVEAATPTRTARLKGRRRSPYVVVTGDEKH